ncbi:hypothetical protein DL1_20150 [Thioclava dalianensis]|uniref:Glycosyltransferase 2-like domain-containing protein n=1 Tax=Thioclava dalianensis TaxID=1185766 RepID=A0A074TEN3_9RHOB|nr:glycosyltransferase family 2 protein [Thioclava dalianensis]KEP70134.1 hypothetical protein DL1_20150 [Thioclava dalianensis]SFN51410.1 Glycosyl transferase family 2 [Thioclava dalianensis]
MALSDAPANATEPAPLAEASTSDLPRYAALIRAYDCAPVLRYAIQKLQSQTHPPAEILIVDSSNNPETSAKFAALGARVVLYPDEPFNYSKAINVGVAANPHPYTFIISSHVLLDDPGMIAAGFEALRARALEIVYWGPRPFSEPEAILTEIDTRRFNGGNGLSNSAAMVPTQLLRARVFRPEVFSAEDQEWSRYYFSHVGKAMLRVESPKFFYLNPNHGMNWSMAKVLNEELAIGHFVNRRLIMPDRIAARFLRGILATLRRRPDRARLHFGVARDLFWANFRQPTRNSRYF